MVFGELLAALLNSSAGRRSLSDDPQLLAQRVLLGREGRELLVPEFHPFWLRERGHRMDHGSLPLRQFVDLTHQVDDFRHVLPGFRVVLAVEALDVEKGKVTLPRRTCRESRALYKIIEDGGRPGRLLGAGGCPADDNFRL